MGNPCTIVRNDGFVGIIKIIAWIVLGEQRPDVSVCLCRHRPTLYLKCCLPPFCYMNWSVWGTSSLSKFHNDEQKIKLRQVQMRTKDEARGKKSGEIQVIQDGAGMFHHYWRETWLAHKGVQPTRKIKENRELLHLPLGDSFLAALGTHLYALSQLLLLRDEDNKFYLFQNVAVTITWKHCKISHAGFT